MTKSAASQEGTKQILGTTAKSKSAVVAELVSAPLVVKPMPDSVPVAKAAQTPVNAEVQKIAPKQDDEFVVEIVGEDWGYAGSHPIEAQPISFDGNEFRAFGLGQGLEGGGSGSGYGTPNKDVLITPRTTATNVQDTISQIDFKWIAQDWAGLTQLNASEVKASLYSYGETMTGMSYYTPAIILGGSWNGTVYAPSATYGSGSTGNSVTPTAFAINEQTGLGTGLIFRPATGSIDAAQYNNLGIYVPNGVSGTQFTLTSYVPDTFAPGVATKGRAFTVAAGDITVQGNAVNTTGASVLNLPSASLTVSSGITGSTTLPVITLATAQTTNTALTLNLLYSTTPQYNLASVNNPNAGDIFYGTANNTALTALAKLASGTSAVLAFNTTSVAPVWASTTTNNLVLQSSTAAGNVAVFASIDLSGASTSLTNILKTASGGTGADLHTATAGQMFVSAGGTPATFAAVTPGTSNATVLAWNNSASTISLTINASATATPTNNYLAQYDASGYLYATTPVSTSVATTVATKSYVDSVAQGLSPKASVRAASVSTFETNVAAIFGNGTGLAAASNPWYTTGTITWTGNSTTYNAYITTNINVGAQTAGTLVANASTNVNFYTAFDTPSGAGGALLKLGDRVLIKDLSTAVGTSYNNTAGTSRGAANGVYVLIANGSNILMLARSLDADAPAEIGEGAFVFVEEGTVQADTGWTQIDTTTVLDPITSTGVTITDVVTFSQFTGAGDITNGQGIQKNANTVGANINIQTSTTSFTLGGNAVAPFSNNVAPTLLVSSTTAGTMTLQQNATGWQLQGGFTTSKTLTLSDSITLSGGSNTLTLANSLSTTGSYAITLSSSTASAAVTLGITTGGTLALGANTLTLGVGLTTSGTYGVTLSSTGAAGAVALTVTSGGTLALGSGTLALGGFTLTASSTSTLSLNSQTLTMSASMGNVTLGGTGSSATTLTLVQSGTTQYNLSTTAGTWYNLGLFYSTNTIQSALSITPSPTRGQLLAANGSSLAYAWVGGTANTAFYVNASGDIVAGTLPTNAGGTSLTSFGTNGGVMYASSASALAILAPSGTASSVMIQTAINGAPSWTAGPLTVGYGGTGLTSFTANGIVYASSTSALATSASLTWNGTTLAVGGPATITLGKTTVAASATSYASLNIPSGAAPTSPVLGDIYFDGANINYWNGSAWQHLATTTGGGSISVDGTGSIQSLNFFNTETNSGLTSSINTTTANVSVQQSSAFYPTWMGQHAFSYVTAATSAATGWGLRVLSAPSAIATAAAMEMGAATAFDGSTNGYFNGSGSGTYLAMNASSAFAGDLVNAGQIVGTVYTSRFKLTAAGVATIGAGLTVGAGGATITGNSSVAGTFGVTTGLTTLGAGLSVTSSGAAITGNSSVTGTLGVSNTLSLTASGAAGITWSNNSFTVVSAGQMAWNGTSLSIYNTAARNLLYADFSNVGSTALPTSAGGTGFAGSFTLNGVIYASSATALASLTPGSTAQSVMIQASANGAPSWSAGPLPAGYGGTGASSAFTANGVVYASSTSALTTNANLTWNGSTLAVTGAATVSNGFTVSAGGATISSGQNFTLSAMTTNGGVLYTGATGIVAQSANLIFNGTQLGIGGTPSVPLTVTLTASADPAILVTAGANAYNASIAITNSGGTAKFFLVGVANAIVTGTALGDTGYVAPTGKTFWLTDTTNIWAKFTNTTSQLNTSLATNGVLFVNSATAGLVNNDNSNLAWDSTNKRLAVGTSATSLTGKLHLVLGNGDQGLYIKAGGTPGASFIQVQNNGATTTWFDLQSTGVLVMNNTNVVPFTISDTSITAPRFRVDLSAGAAGITLGLDSTTASNHISMPIAFTAIVPAATSVLAHCVVTFNATDSQVVPAIMNSDASAVGVALTNSTTTGLATIKVARYGRVTINKITANITGSGQLDAPGGTINAAINAGDYVVIANSTGQIGSIGTTRPPHGYIGRAMQTVVAATGTVDVLVGLGVGEDNTVGNFTGSGSPVQLPLWITSTQFGSSLAYEDSSTTTNVFAISSSGTSVGTQFLKISNIQGGGSTSQGQTTFLVGTPATATNDYRTATVIINPVTGQKAAGVAAFAIQGASTAPVMSVDGLGNLRANSKSFDIPHPTKPGKRLIYGVLEGPEHGVYHRGRVAGRGKVRVTLPEYWSKLAHEGYTVQLTACGPYSVYLADKGADSFTVARTGLFGRFRALAFEFYVVGSRRDISVTIEEDEHS